MKRFIVALFAALLVGQVAFARDVYVRPHVKSDGTYVEGHYRTSPNNSNMDNFSTRGNVNPYTGQTGTKNPDLDVYRPPRQRK